MYYPRQDFRFLGSAIMTRTNEQHQRIYINGYDLSGDYRKIGNYGYKSDFPKDAAFSDGVMNGATGRTQVTLGSLNAFMSPNSGVGAYDLQKAGNVISDVMIPIGILAAPVVGVPVWCWQMSQAGISVDGKDLVGLNIEFPDSAFSSPLNYKLPFGLLVHAKGAETGANTAVGTIDNGASSALGGVFAYQVFSSNGTFTLSIDDSATNANNAAFAALSGATSGSIDASVTPKSGFIQLSTSATVRRYLRWQLALGTATTVNFACAFIRGV